MLKHALIEGFKNITRSFWLSATAISVLTVSLGSVAVIATFSTAVGFTLRQLNDQLVITAYLKRDIEQSTIDTATKEITALEGVKSVRFVNEEDARKELISNTNINASLSQTLQNQEIDLVLAFLEIVPADVASYDRISDTIRGDRYANLWDSIQDNRDFRLQLERFYFYTNIVLIVLVAVFALTSILVMVNILRIAIYSHRDEIEVMRLVGATNNYIRGPFIAEGAFFNIIAAIIILVTYIPAVSILLPNIENFFRISNSDNTSLIAQMYLSVAVTLTVGVLSGVITSYIATQRYLKL